MLRTRREAQLAFLGFETASASHEDRNTASIRHHDEEWFREQMEDLEYRFSTPNIGTVARIDQLENRVATLENVCETLLERIKRLERKNECSSQS